MQRMRRFALIVLCLWLVATGTAVWSAGTPATGILDRTLLADGQRRVMVVGHRAGGFFAPENTLAAIDLAIEVGCDGVELDVQRTADGHFVLMHDPTVDRTTNGSGTIAEMTLAQIRELEVRWTPQSFLEDSQFPVPPKGKRFRNLRVPTLGEALDQARGRVFVMLDLKQEDAEGVARLVAAKGLLGDVIFKVNSITEGEAVQGIAPEACVMARADNEEELYEMVEALAPRLAHLDDQTFRSDVINDMHQAGAKVWMNALGQTDVQAALADGKALRWVDRVGSTLGDLLTRAFEPHTKPYLKLGRQGADVIQTDNIVRVVEAMESFRQPLPRHGD